MEGRQPSPLETTSADASRAPSRGRLVPAIVTLSATGLVVLGTWGVTQHPSFLETLVPTVRQATAGLLAPSAPPRPDPATVASQVPVRLETSATSAEWRPTPSDQGDRPTSSMVGHRTYGIGDKIKINFYEKIVVEEDKWGRSGSALKSLQNRPELSGEFSVQDDGTIAVPLIGTVAIADRTTAQIEADLMKAFHDLVGRRGMVSILSSERQPIYVVGPVKNSGSYKFVPNMTVLHAVALAGGLESGAGDPWQRIEGVRTIQKRSGASDAMLKLLARLAVLTAERDNVPVRMPAKLTEMAGAKEAQIVLTEQSDKRRALTTARRNRELSIHSAVDSAKQDVNLVVNRLGPLEELIRLRQGRVAAMTSLVDKSLLSKSTLNQVQAELIEADQRRVETLSQYTQVKQRLHSLETDSARLISDMRSELETEIETADRQLHEQEREYAISDAVLSSLPSAPSQLAGSKDVSLKVYRVVRQASNGPIELAATGMTVLQPGDLVNITTASEQLERTPRPLLAPDHAASTEAPTIR